MHESEFKLLDRLVKETECEPKTSMILPAYVNDDLSRVKWLCSYRCSFSLTNGTLLVQALSLRSKELAEFLLSVPSSALDFNSRKVLIQSFYAVRGDNQKTFLAKNDISNRHRWIFKHLPNETNGVLLYVFLKALTFPLISYYKNEGL